MIKVSFRKGSGKKRKRAVMLSPNKAYIWKEWNGGFPSEQTARGCCDRSDLPRYIALNIDSSGPNKWHDWPLKAGEGVRTSNRRAQ